MFNDRWQDPAAVKAFVADNRMRQLSSGTRNGRMRVQHSQSRSQHRPDSTGMRHFDGSESRQASRVESSRVFS